MTTDEPRPSDDHEQAPTPVEADTTPIERDAALDAIEVRPMDLEELEHALQAPTQRIDPTVQELVDEGALLDWGGVYAMSWPTIYRRHPEWAMRAVLVALAVGSAFLLVMEWWRA